MATKLENLDLEVAHLNHFLHHIPGVDDFCRQTVESLTRLGVIQVSTAYEHALANVGGYEVVSLDSADLSDGPDAKLTTVRTSSRGKSYSAPVSDVHGKSGAMRVQVFERKFSAFYYLVIPNNAYSAIPHTSNIEIPFELDGEPRRKPKGRRTYANWWDFEVGSFEELAKAPSF